MLTTPRLWIGLAVTVGFLALLFFRVDFQGLTDALAEANYAYLAPGIAIYFVSLYFRSLRWGYLLKPFAQTKLARLYPVVLVGYMVNNILPLRAGEVVRSYYLSTREPVSTSTGLATIIIERVFDGVTMLFLLLVGALFLPLSGLPQRVSEAVNLPSWLVTVTAVMPFVVVLTLIIIAALRPRPFRQISALLSRRLPHRYAEAAQGIAERFIDGFQGLHRPERLAWVFVLSLPIWITEGAMYYVIGLGFGLHVPLGGYWMLAAAMLVVVSLSNLSTSIPSSQGSVGPFEFFAALSLIFLGVSSGLASAYAIVLHLALLLPVIGAGLAYLASQSTSLGQLTRRRMDTTAGERL